MPRVIVERHDGGKVAIVEHGVVSSFPEEFFGYFGWPTVVQTEAGTLVVAASGLRNDHVCPFGRYYNLS